MKIQYEDMVNFYNFSFQFLRSNYQIYNVIILFLNIYIYFEITKIFFHPRMSIIFERIFGLNQ